jgi:hypothetical protein
MCARMTRPNSRNPNQTRAARLAFAAVGLSNPREDLVRQILLGANDSANFN